MPIRDVTGMQHAVAEAMAYGVDNGLCVAGKEVMNQFIGRTPDDLMIWTRAVTARSGAILHQ